MVAILSRAYGCSMNDTYVNGIYYKKKDAIPDLFKYLSHGYNLKEFRWIDFKCGEVGFTFDEANEIFFNNGKIKFNQKRGE